MIVVLCGRVLLYPVEILNQVRVSVGETVRKVLHIVIVLEGVRECERVVASLESLVVALVVVHVVINVLADSMPSNALRLLDLGRESQDLIVAILI